MSDLTPKTLYQTYQADQKTGPLHRPLFYARLIAIAVAVGGAIPTGYNLYESWVHGIPFSQVGHRLEQYDIWTKNIDCKINYHSVTTGGTKGTTVDVGACPTTGDIALRLTTITGRSTYEWISFAALEREIKSFAALGLFVTPAEAQERGHEHAGGGGPGATGGQGGDRARGAGEKDAEPRSAPGGAYAVHCETMSQPGHVTRIVSEGDKCYRVGISMMSGRMDQRAEVPCDTRCVGSH